MKTTTLLAALALGLSIPAVGHGQQTLRPGAALDGALSPGDARLNSGEFMDVYELDGRSGDRLTILMTSGAVDSYLMMDGPGGFRDENDDAESGDLDSRLDVRLPVSGRYRIVATSFAPGETGAYRITVSDGSQAPAGGNPGGGVIAPGQTVSGTLASGDDRLDSGEYRDSWILRGRRGERLVARLSSSDFDPYLMVRAPGLSEDNDDDPSERGGLDSRLAFTVPDDGEVVISATSFEPGETGRYSLSLTRADDGLSRPDPAPGAATGTLAVGEHVRGRLGDGDAQLRSGEYVNTFTLRGRAGERVEIALVSEQFDPFLMLSGPDGFSTFNDDDPAGNGGLDSRLIVTLPADGLYEITATSYAPGESGDYRLSVARPGAGVADTRTGGDQAGVSGGRLSIGESVSGSLTAGDDQLDSGEYTDRYTFIGRRGQRVAIDAVSDEFDTYLMLSPPTGDQIDNDDGPEGVNARLNEVLAEDGEYTVQVTSFAPGETGRYTLSVAPGQESERQRAVQAGQRVFAVMVGVSDYPGDHNDLPFTDEDAVKLEEELARQGVLNPASVVLTNAGATRASVTAAFQRVAAQAGPDDLFIFFFSGHGVQEDSDDSAELDGQREMLSLHDGDLSDDELAALFDSVDARLSLLVIDACYSGGFARDIITRPGVMGVFSSEEDLTSAVADKFQAGGYLSHFLRAGLEGAADDNGDDLVTAGELSTYLRQQFRVEVADVEAETADGQRNYQNLVIDRGGVQVDDVIIRLAGA
ncbi:MAG: pre-peptidase C-terminal domain-containing protein [Brevundimonas sp.]